MWWTKYFYFLKNNNPKMRIAAAVALEKIGKLRTVDAIIKGLEERATAGMAV